MRKVLLFYLLFCMVGCTKEEYAEPKRRINEQVCDYITLLGTLPAEQVAPEMRQTLYSMKDEAHYIKDADKIGDTGEGYYEIELAGIHKRAAMAVTDIVPQINNPSSIYPGALVQGQSVREGNPNPGRFGCIHIYREFAGCTAEFSLDYMFHSSFTTYPKVEPFL